MACFFCFRDEGLFCGVARVSQEDLNKIGWRYRVTQARPAAMPGRFCGDSLRCAATRRHTLVTGAVMRTENLEKRTEKRVQTTNNCRVFQCTVNWSRARHN